MALPALAVVVVNWNGSDVLPRCLRAVFAQDYPGPLRVVVVDNASSDGSAHAAVAAHPRVELIERGENNYAAANNQGVVHADGCELVCLLNSDTELEPGCLATLAAALAADTEAAAVMPKVVDFDGRLYSTGVAERDDLRWVDRDRGQPDDGRRDQRERVFGISGCCALWRRTVWQAVGGLIEPLHMHYEDVEISLRVRASGFALLYEPAARVRHVGGASIARTAHGKDPLGERNRLYVLVRHYPERALAECATSPWLRGAPADDVRGFLPLLAGAWRGGREAFLVELALALRDQPPPPRWSLRRRWGKIRRALRP